jgi:phosphoglycolate phosphatase-like HAD superfamily hydrolase
MVHVPQMAGSTESEIFFEALALNAAGAPAGEEAGLQMLGRFTRELAAAFHARRHLLRRQGRLLPGAAEALTAVGRLPGVVQTVLTGAIRANALEKLRAFGLTAQLDTEIGGFGSEVYPKGTLLRVARSRAGEKHGVTFAEGTSVYIGDSPRDVEAARVGGARSIAVASGRATVAELAAAGADAVLADLSDTEAVLRAVGDLTIPAAS